MSYFANITKIILYHLIPIILILNLFSANAYSLECALKSGVCAPTEECIISLSNTTNAHAEECTQGNYLYNVCCKATGYTLTTTYSDGCAPDGGIISLFSQTDSHVEQYPSPIYTIDICLKTGTPDTVDCTYTDNACNVGYTCVISISGTTNAHLANCTGTGNYIKKVCCKIISLPPPPPGNITGTVVDDSGTPLESVTITAQSATETYSNTTSASGTYIIHDVNSSTYTVTATKSGYIPNTTAGVVVSPSATTIVDFILQHMPASGISEDAIVHFQNKENLVMHIGSRQMIPITAKNPTNDYALVPLHIGSPDTTFRNFIHFEESRISRNDLNITLRPNEERTILIEIFAGKTGNYELIVGPDNIYGNKYDSARVAIINKNAGIFAQTPGLKSVSIILIILLAIILISRAENHRFKPTINALKPKNQE